MSDRYVRSYSRPSGSNYSYGGSVPASSGSFDPVLNRYVREEEAKSQKRKFQPLRMLFDILSRPQYVTANIAEEITRSIQTGEPLGQAAMDAIRGAWEGVTGKRKGDWEKILFGGTAEGSTAPDAFSGWFPGAGEQLSHPLIKFKPSASGEERGILRPKKLIGLAANIVMDPTTWIGVGPTKAARASAKRFAADAAEVAMKNPDLGAELIRRIDPKLAENAASLIERLKSGVKYTTERYVTDIAKTAKRRALNESGETLRKGLLETITDYISKMPEETGERTAAGLANLMDRLKKEGVTYGGAGRRTLTLFGQNVMDVPQGPISKGWDVIQNALPKSATGQKFSDALWAVMEKGPIGAVRRFFGFRNPYQTILHSLERNQQQWGDAVNLFEKSKIQQVFKSHEDLDTRLLQDAMDKAYVVKRSNPDANTFDVLNRPEIFGLTIDKEQRKSYADLYSKLKQTSDEWWAELQPGIDEKAIDAFGYVDNYIPRREELDALYYGGKSTGAGRPSFAKPKEMGFEENIESAMAGMDAVFGDVLRPAAEAQPMPYEQFLAWAVRDKGFSSGKMDLQEMFLARATAQAKALQRIQMVRDFKQFGIPISEMEELPMAAGITGTPLRGIAWPWQEKRLPRPGEENLPAIRNIASVPQTQVNVAPSIPKLPGRPVEESLLPYAQKLGLYRADDPAFAGYLFDEEVAGIINRIYSINTREGKNTIGLAFKWWTQWWKSLVTLSPGFHVRNWMANEVTDLIKNGIKALDPALMKPTTIGVMYGMNPSKYVDMITQQFKVSKGAIAIELNKAYHGTPLKELADYSVDHGVIGWMSRGFEVADTSTRGQKLNRIIGTKSPVIRFSQSVGSVIENSSKFKDFLINFGEAIDGGASKDEALEWAAAETKKWFLDYGDLTDKEKFLRNLIPFYSWLRKNIANQLTGFLFYPGAYNIIGKVQKSATNEEGFDYSLVPEYFEQQGMFPVSTDPETGYPILFRPDFPFKDINLIPFVFEEGSLIPKLEWRQATDDIIQSAHPLIKTIMSLAPEKGWNFFRRTDIRKQETAPAIFQYFTKNPKILGFLDGVLRLAGFEEGVKADMNRDNNRVLMDGKVVTILENNMPSVRILGNLLNMAEQGAKVISGRGDMIEELIENITGKRDYYEGLEAMLRVITRFGVKFQTLNTDYYGQVQGQKVLDAARERKRSDEYSAITAKTRRMASEKSRLATLRRYGLGK